MQCSHGLSTNRSMLILNIIRGKKSSSTNISIVTFLSTLHSITLPIFWDHFCDSCHHSNLLTNFDKQKNIVCHKQKIQTELIAFYSKKWCGKLNKIALKALAKRNKHWAQSKATLPHISLYQSCFFLLLFAFLFAFPFDDGIQFESNLSECILGFQPIALSINLDAHERSYSTLSVERIFSHIRQSNWISNGETTNRNICKIILNPSREWNCWWSEWQFEESRVWIEISIIQKTKSFKTVIFFIGISIKKTLVFFHFFKIHMNEWFKEVCGDLLRVFMKSANIWFERCKLLC